eukprot:1160786-Pelagomonas_calceolata.AAC.9
MSASMPAAVPCSFKAIHFCITFPSTSTAVCCSSAIQLSLRSISGRQISSQAMPKQQHHCVGSLGNAAQGTVESYSHSSVPTTSLSRLFGKYSIRDRGILFTFQ